MGSRDGYCQRIRTGTAIQVVTRIEGRAVGNQTIGADYGIEGVCTCATGEVCTAVRTSSERPSLTLQNT